MQTKHILITGASGFLGSHIAEELVNAGYDVIALKRKSSNLYRCDNFHHLIKWIDIDNEDLDWQVEIAKFNPSVIIHSAWNGVIGAERNDLIAQFKNLDFILMLLELAGKLKIKTFIGLGSQAEYGTTNNEVSENEIAQPNNAYAHAKVIASKFIKSFCDSHNITWYWLRLFTFFGEREEKTWFIPSIIHSLKNKELLNMTEGLQQYSYLYVKDMTRALLPFISSNAEKGIYNISSCQARTLRSVVEIVVGLMKADINMIQFGAIPYKEGQSMMIKGDMSKYTTKIGILKESDFQQSITNTINYYLYK